MIGGPSFQAARLLETISTGIELMIQEDLVLHTVPRSPNIRVQKLIVHRVHPQDAETRPSSVQQVTTISMYQNLGSMELIVRENEKPRPRQALGHFHASLVRLEASCRGCKLWRVVPSVWLRRNFCIPEEPVSCTLARQSIHFSP